MFKSSAIASVLMLASFGFANACTTVRGSGNSAAINGIQMWLNSNGVDVCYVKKSGVGAKMSGSMDCNSGYSATYNWGAITGGVDIKYVGPGGPLNFNAPTDCENYNCCGGQVIPCTCWVCTISVALDGCKVAGRDAVQQLDGSSNSTTALDSTDDVKKVNQVDNAAEPAVEE
ncbi:hypothetical protein DL96DRAFT_1684271 [Flagelloscypha sp. PMI_526]|nr:hypothetical protein DL96DRAFT_1684271 [Flagelloscypha sp. PMI_526]